MSQRRAGVVNRCLRCRINSVVCVCAHIKPLQIVTNISLIVHVRELKLTSNTAQFVQLMLPEQASFSVRGSVNGVFDSTPIMERPGLPLFLYPDEEAQELNAEFLARYPGPYHLIIPDGNWHQARRVKKREPAFKKIISVKLPPGPPSEYLLRRAPQPHWLSTYEAVAHAIGVLEGEAIRDELMRFFRTWVRTTLYCRTQDSRYLVES